jgi:hypothetical protein
MRLNERGKPMPWLISNSTRRGLRWTLLIVSVTGCSPISGNQYFCPPTITFDQNGSMQPETYAVDRTCYKRMTEKLAACYADASP